MLVCVIHRLLLQPYGAIRLFSGTESENSSVPPKSQDTRESNAERYIEVGDRNSECDSLLESYCHLGSRFESGFWELELTRSTQFAADSVVVIVTKLKNKERALEIIEGDETIVRNNKLRRLDVVGIERRFQ